MSWSSAGCMAEKIRVAIPRLPEPAAVSAEQFTVSRDSVRLPTQKPAVGPPRRYTSLAVDSRLKNFPGLSL